MPRYSRWFLGFVVLASMTGREAHAQWGFGGWGWGGWGGGVATPESAALEGAGSYAMGAGMYNLDTAQARSINADTAMRFNEYTAAVSDESARVYAARNNQQYAKNRSLYEQPPAASRHPEPARYRVGRCPQSGRRRPERSPARQRGVAGRQGSGLRQPDCHGPLRLCVGAGDPHARRYP